MEEKGCIGFVRDAEDGDRAKDVKVTIEWDGEINTHSGKVALAVTLSDDEIASSVVGVWNVLELAGVYLSAMRAVMNAVRRAGVEKAFAAALVAAEVSEGADEDHE